ncbi:hypothetical protein HPB47_001958 [Ixodes persulcatus]|uniref:Uncharacterized protein n=1 Tax=Ixodes persulcatus TaxID=34615 RepID=A0AC60PMK7_IXOPE|nr:hypothetical protein HPB47_001958 [Ixodes persulcatus]
MFRETRQEGKGEREREEVPKEAERVNSRSQCEDLHGLLPTVQLVQQRTGAARRMKSQANVVQPHRHDRANVTRPSVQRGVLAGSKYDSNVYIDSIVSTVLPANARSLGLDSVDVASYAFIVKSTSLTNRDLHAEFHGGKLVGLVSPGLVRWGDCSAPGWQGFNVTLGCYLSLDNLHLSYVGSAKGDSVLNTNKTISLNVVPVKSSAFIEVTSGSGMLAGRKVAVAVVYLWTGADSRETNIELIKCIEKDYHSIGRPTIVVGDFSARLEEFDGRTDGNGKLL